VLPAADGARLLLMKDDLSPMINYSAEKDPGSGIVMGNPDDRKRFSPRCLRSKILFEEENLS
jgi:hypothetical protein